MIFRSIASARNKNFPVLCTPVQPQNIQKMIKSLLKIGALLVACILIYNFFFGTSQEKETSRKIFGEMKDVVVSVGSLIRTEKDKFDAGKYDGALDKLGGAYRAVRGRAEHLDAGILKRLDELEQRKAQLDKELDTIEATEKQLNTPPPATPVNPKKTLKKDPKQEQTTAAKTADQQRRKEQLLRELEKLTTDTEKLLQDASQ